ncbi:MAG: tRNA-dihydrouridine synthase family protein [Eubacterium sp.]|nr:tRNA-dihydrouridine synthase family protein [Eubacterium sp.]
MFTNIYLAPMEGITTYIFRNALAKYYGGIDKYYTPFLTASHLKGRELRDVHPDNNQGIDLVPQILTNDSELFLQISEQLIALGYKEININLGCPSGTVVSKGRGSGFLNYPEKLDIFLDEVLNGLNKLGSDIHLSVKTRIGYEFLSEWDDILEVYRKYPLSELIIHPRLRNEFYTGRIHMDEFLKAGKCISKETELVYNGDIVDINSYNEKLSSLKDAGLESRNRIPVMIGRGVIENPELPQILKPARETEVSGPDIKTLKSFLNEITENYVGEMSNDRQVVMKMKELWTYLSLGLNLDKKLLREIHKTNKLPEYKSVQQMILSGL